MNKNVVEIYQELGIKAEDVDLIDGYGIYVARADLESAFNDRSIAGGY